jgi:hypothetical protein
MITSFFAKFSAIMTSELLPCRAGSALKLGESMIVNWGSAFAAATGSSMNRLRQNRLCQANSLITLTGKR